MDSGLTGTIFDISRYAIHDGPGIRTTVFFKGCPLRCIWCANPESQAYRPERLHDRSQCLGCGTCCQECPNRAISMSRQEPVRDAVKCGLCGHCEAVCPAEAVQIMGRTVSPESLYREIEIDRPFWDRSGGGVTLSGGEPLAQYDFVLAFLKICRDRHVSVAIETCLHAEWEQIKAVLQYADHMICDLKVMNRRRHKTLTGVSNNRIKDNIRALLHSQADVLVRMPLIPGINDDKDNLQATGAFLEAHRRGARIELLPYHSLGEAKYRRMNRPCPMGRIAPPSEADMARAGETLQAFGIRVVAK